jgi:hypothetical protein
MLLMDELQLERHYVRQWEAAVQRSLENFERGDIREIEEIRTLDDIQSRLSQWRLQITKQTSLQALAMLFPTFSHLHVFINFFQESMSEKIAVSIIWGKTFLVVKLADEANEILRLAGMLKVIGHKIELFNGFSKTETAPRQLKAACLDVLLEYLDFLTNVITFFRERNFESGEEETMRPLNRFYLSAIGVIDDSFERIERFAQLAKFSSHVDEVTKLQNILSISGDAFKDQAKLPCVMLPQSRNTRVYDREEYLDRIDQHFQSASPEQQGFRSLALYGVGGVGKSHVALKYAYRKIRELEAIFWIPSQTSAALAQGFSDVAMRLQIPEAKPHNHSENRVLVLSWLQQTACKWLLIFDNAENPNLLLEYWPVQVSSNGAALVTTRNHALAFQPAETGIEILSFDSELGSKFVLHLLSMDISHDLSSGEIESARELSEKLSGHALAINNMAGLIHRRSWSIREFLSVYENNTEKLHDKTLATIWKLSFESLDAQSGGLLGVLSYVVPDSIPQELFRTPSPEDLPSSLQFCSDELECVITPATDFPCF